MCRWSKGLCARLRVRDCEGSGAQRNAAKEEIFFGFGKESALVTSAGDKTRYLLASRDGIGEPVKSLE